jgi:hypothetical protein
MSFPINHEGTLRPEEFTVVRNVYSRIVHEPWVTKDQSAHAEFAKLVLRLYDRGMCHPEKLFRLCLVAARQKLADTSVSDGSGQTDPGQ